MPTGFILSIACHVGLLVWAVLGLPSGHDLPTEITPAISAELITPSEFLRLKQGSEDAKALETKAKDEPTPDDSKLETKKPDPTPPPPAAEAAPPPPQDVAKAEPEPEPVKPPEPVAEPVKEPPPPEPAPGPTPDEQKLLEEKLEAEQQAAGAEQKKKAEEAKKKAEAEAKKKADELKKKKLAEAAAKKKAEEAKKRADFKNIANLLEKLPGDQQKALVDKDPNRKGQQASGSSKTASATGKEAGTATGTDSVLSAREQDLLKGMIKSRLAGCWRLPGAGGGTETPVVTLRWKLQRDGSLDGEPVVQKAPGDAAGQVAAQAAMRAVQNCAPFELPADKYDGWHDIIWVFDPRQML